MKKAVLTGQGLEGKHPKTDLDRQFLAAAAQAKQLGGLKSDRALSLALGRNPDFINRVRNGFQSAPAEAWHELLTKYPALAGSDQQQAALYQIGKTSISPDGNLLEIENSYLRTQLADKIKIIELQDVQIQFLKSQLKK
ncbi:hypothetical protein [Hymenobacter terricola]|uniref:hypothetical protein n=1 Tax=Hymenobacter terricola TaxID=2819236 RepID=UPI001B3043FB|nr:hypothetical protein [Hymenobacter terricola]